MQKPKRRA